MRAFWLVSIISSDRNSWESEMIRQSANMKLAHFNVRFADGTDYTDALYANGHHQLEIVVEVIKEVVGRFNTWGNVPLTDSERASVEIVPVPTASDESKAVGWICDTEKNKYDPGLWNRTGEDLSERVPRSVVADPRIEIVKRYIRVEENASLEPMQFMATIILDGESVTNSYSEWPTDFQSSVFVAPVLPPELLSTELTETVDYNAFNVVNKLDVDVYYWSGVNGLRFVDNYGLIEPLFVPNEGLMFQTSYGFSGIFKGGVFKNPAALYWYLDTVHQQLPDIEPGSNPVIRRINASIMCAAKLTTTIPELPHLDSKSNWRLRDNFGTLHIFKIVPYESGNRLSIVPVPLKRKVHFFRITLPNGQDSTNALYANSRHQCKVSIEVAVERETGDGGWEAVPLTPEEKASVTVTAYSADVNQPLPLGWACDTNKNIYEIGLWERSAEPAGEQGPQRHADSPASIEVIDRYMRLLAGSSVESRRFMAKIVVGGKVYTTNFKDGSSDFNSWLHISPQRPYRVKVADLRQTRDDPFWDGVWKIDIDVYYWLPPSGLRFISQSGLDAPLQVSHEGDYFHTSFCQRSGRVYRKVGVVVSKNIPGLRLRYNDIHRDAPGHWDNPYIEFNRVNTIMRAVWFSTERPISQGNAGTPWRLIDNYGCEHSFVIREDWNTILLADYEN